MSGAITEEGCANSYYSDLKRCLKVYNSHIKRLKTHIVRLYGYRTTHGVDENILNCSISNLFCPNPGALLFYSSRRSFNVDCTGVVINEDGGESERLFVEYHKFFTQTKLKDIVKNKKIIDKYGYLTNIYWQQLN
jgi:hypothetical protein